MRTPVAIALCALTLPAFATAEGGPGGIVENVLFAVDHYAGALVEHDDAGTGADAGNVPAAAIPVETGRTYFGRTGPRALDAADWYAFTLPPRSSVSAFLCGVYGPDALFVDEAGVERGPSWYYNWCARMYATTVAGGEWKLRIADVADGSGSGVASAPIELAERTRAYSLVLRVTTFAHGEEARIAPTSALALRAFLPPSGIGEIVVEPAAGDVAFVKREIEREGTRCYVSVATGFHDAPAGAFVAGAGAAGVGASAQAPVAPPAPGQLTMGAWAAFLDDRVDVDLLASQPLAYRVNLLWNGDEPAALSTGASEGAATFARISDFAGNGPAIGAGPAGAAALAKLPLALDAGRELVVGVDARAEPGALAPWVGTNDLPESALRVVDPRGYATTVRDDLFALRYAVPGEHRVEAASWANVEDGRYRVAAASLPAAPAGCG